jgi:hypothetical protein
VKINSTKPLRIPITVFGNPYHLFLDTGSSVSLISQSVVPQTRIDKLDHLLTIKGVGPGLIYSYHKVTLPITVEKISLSSTFFIVDTLPFDILFGNDNLRKHGISIDLLNNTVTVGSLSVALIDAPSLSFNISALEESYDFFPIRLYEFRCTILHSQQLLPSPLVAIELSSPTHYTLLSTPKPLSFIPSFNF